MLTYNKTYDGPFDLEFLVSPATSQYARTGVHGDSLVLTGTVEQAEMTLGDGSKCYWLEGLEGIMEIQISEVDPVDTTGDIVKILASNLMTATFVDPARVLTVGAGGTIGADNIKVDLTDYGMKITVKFSGYIGQDWADLLTMPVGS